MQLFFYIIRIDSQNILKASLNQLADSNSATLGSKKRIIKNFALK